MNKQEHLAGSVFGACDSWLQDHEFEPHIGCGDYLTNKIFNKKQTKTRIRPVNTEYKPMATRGGGE